MADHFVPTAHGRRGTKGLLAPLALFSIIVVGWLAGAFESFDLSLMDLRFRALQRAPSDTLVVVEIDPKSLREEERWPWPRSRYAQAVENLQDAGATLIGFDIDFSSRLDKAGDEAFRKALERRPGEVVLPVFAQLESRTDPSKGVITTPPHPEFLSDVVVASVNLTPEVNGLVRRGWLGARDNDSIRSSMAATLAGATYTNAEGFYIDYSINPARIARLSFHDVLTGRFSSEAVAGKKVLIGAAALELGDEFATPNYGILPGVMLHAMSYESVVSGRTIQRIHPLAPLLASFGFLIWFFLGQEKWSWRRLLVLNGAVLVGLIGLPLAVQLLTPVSIDVSAVIATQFLCVLFVGVNRINKHASQLLKQRAATLHFQSLTRLVVQDSADGVIVADPTGVIELCSDRARALLGLKDTVEPGRNVLSLVRNFPLHPSVAPSSGAAISVDLTEWSVVNELEIEGEEARTLEIVATQGASSIADPAANLSTHLVVYTIRDVSVRKRIEAAERATKEAAIAANRAKTQLIANMSHEFRTPLNGIIGFADVLRKESFGSLGCDEYKEFSKLIYESGKRLSVLVVDMMTIAKLDADEYILDKDETSIEEVLESCIEDAQSCEANKLKAISLDVEKALPRAQVDSSACAHMIERLLSNALKFTGDEGKIRIKARSRGDDLILVVTDNGCGVDRKLLPSLGRMFQQGDGSLNRNYEGAGLGLFIVKRIAKLHGAELRLRSKKGLGFSATIRFPRVLARRAASVAA